MYVVLAYVAAVRELMTCIKLLLPEIRMTVSNLSQAIRFLVDNDFLDNVELKPGDAQPKIEVLSETTATDAPHTL
jgi:hypothetical protein